VCFVLWPYKLKQSGENFFCVQFGVGLSVAVACQMAENSSAQQVRNENAQLGLLKQKPLSLK
jgi:hypothetical protein